MTILSRLSSSALLVFLLQSCASNNYPPNTSAAERQAYYRAFNESKTAAEWAASRAERQSEADETPAESATEQKPNSAASSSIAFSIQNNSLFPKRLRIADNVLDFKPFEIRYVGFPADTKVFLIRGAGADHYLFAITEDQAGRTFKITN